MVDGHDDFAVVIRYFHDNLIDTPNFTNPFENGSLPLHVDLARLKKGKTGGTFWVAFTDCPSEAENFSDAIYTSS